MNLKFEIYLESSFGGSINSNDLPMEDLAIWNLEFAVTVRKGKSDETRTKPLARAQKESLTIRLEVREDYAREIKSDALFITRLGTRPTGESIRKIIKSKLRQLGIDEKGIAVHALRHLFASAYNEATQNDLEGEKK